MSDEPAADKTALEGRIMRAHARGDSHALATLYAQGARLADTVDSACFLATQAYIYSLESNHENQERLQQFLIEQGRERG